MLETSNSFINIFAILQDFNGIFSKYSFNITVLCGYLCHHSNSNTLLTIEENSIHQFKLVFFFFFFN